MAPTAEHHPSPPPANRPHAPTVHPSRRLRRQNAIIILSPTEQALADAMVQSSPPPPDPSPSSILGRRARSDGGEDSGDSTEPDTSNPPPRGATAPAQPTLNSLQSPQGRVAADLRRYAFAKKLRTEQRDQVEDFLMVSGIPGSAAYRKLKCGEDAPLAREARLFVNLLAVENKLDGMRSAAVFQLSDGLKVCCECWECGSIERS